MWLEVGETEDSIIWWMQHIMSQDVVGGRTDDIMVDAMYKEPQCGRGSV